MVQQIDKMATRRPRGRADRLENRSTRRYDEEYSTGSHTAMGSGMFFAAPAPPPHRTRTTPTGTPGRRDYPLKPAPQNIPISHTNANQEPFPIATADVECSAAEKLAFDELLRVQRGRAEDVGKLIASLGASLGAPSPASDAMVAVTSQSEQDKDRRAAKYREEWRVARENDVLERMCDGEARDAALSADREQKSEALRSHVRRSIHCFLTIDRSSDAATHKAKLSNDLFYAQQMDRLLREIDTQPPFAVVRQAIADARAKFQQLLLCCSSSSGAAALLASERQPGQLTPESLSTASPQTNLLDLYENVVDARSVMRQPALPVTTHKRKNKKLRTPRVVDAPIAPSAAFQGHLEQQRDEAESRTRETLAQHHWQRLCAKRIRSTYAAYRERQRHRIRLMALMQRTRQRAAIVLQTKFRRVVQAYRALADARNAMQRRWQGRRIASCCFWRWIYTTRCGFSTFRLTVVIASQTTGAIVRATGDDIVQHATLRFVAPSTHFDRTDESKAGGTSGDSEHWYWVVLLSLLPSLLVLTRLRFRQVTASASQQLAEWHCHVAIEKRCVARELQREQLRYTTEWTRYEARLEKEVLKAKLSSEWIPQLDPVSGETFYLNVQTSKTTSEHPNRALLRQLLKKQKLRADELYQERQHRLMLYAEGLDAQSDAAAANFERSYRAQLVASREM